MADDVRVCDVCGGEIEADRQAETGRLRTHLCARHREEIKKYGGEYIGTGKHDNAGRGLKGITVGVTVEFRRNDEGVERLKDEYDREKWAKKARERKQQDGGGA